MQFGACERCYCRVMLRCFDRIRERLITCTHVAVTGYILRLCWNLCLWAQRTVGDRECRVHVEESTPIRCVGDLITQWTANVRGQSHLYVLAWCTSSLAESPKLVVWSWRGQSVQLANYSHVSFLSQRAALSRIIKLAGFGQATSQIGCRCDGASIASVLLPKALQAYRTHYNACALI